MEERATTQLAIGDLVCNLKAYNNGKVIIMENGKRIVIKFFKQKVRYRKFSKQDKDRIGDIFSQLGLHINNTNYYIRVLGSFTSAFVVQIIERKLKNGILNDRIITLSRNEFLLRQYRRIIKINERVIRWLDLIYQEYKDVMNTAPNSVMQEYRFKVLPKQGRKLLSVKCWRKNEELVNIGKCYLCPYFIQDTVTKIMCR